MAKKSAPAKTYRAAMPKKVSNKLKAEYNTFLLHKTMPAEITINNIKAIKTACITGLF